MLGMETVAERMADYFVRHHPTMPGSGKKAQAVDAARCLEDSAHASMMTSVPRPGKTTLRRAAEAVIVTRLRKEGDDACHFLKRYSWPWQLSYLPFRATPESRGL